MMVETEKNTIAQIEDLKQYLPDKTQEELEQILAYGEKIRAEGERKKKKWWSKSTATDFRNLLIYKKNHKKEINGKYEYLDKMDGLERERFIEEYLHDDMLYSGKAEERDCSYDYYDYEGREKGHVVLKELDNLYCEHIGDEGAKAVAEKIKLEDGVELYLGCCNIGVEGIEAISKMKLKDGVTLDLSANEFGAEGVKVIAKNLKLKDGVKLYLVNNRIGDEGAEAISHMELKEGVVLRLERNLIGAEGAKAISRMKLKKCVVLDLPENRIKAEGAKAIAENMDLKEGVVLNLNRNKIGDEGAKAIAEKMELKECVTLRLGFNKIGDVGAEAISHMKLKECVYLDLSGNRIGDEGAAVIMKQLKLKKGVTLDLRRNEFSDHMKRKLKMWEFFYKVRGMKCEVLVY